jgi:glycosyltransferase involved in cell wall biosynthesis
MASISSITITRNSGARIGACLDSLSFCEERVVVDSGSTDDTVRIARERGAKVVHQDWLGFGPQKNFALTLVSGDWVLWLDSDEVVSPELAASIRAAADRSDADGYEMPRRSWFCGRPMRHSGWYPDHVLRLFRRGKGRFSTRAIHEQVVLDGTVKRLAGSILHHPVERLEDALKRMDRYSTLGAQEVLASGSRVWFFTGIVRGLWTFVRTYILRAGFLDGREGFLLAVANAEGTYYRYMKAWIAARRGRFDE